MYAFPEFQKKPLSCVALLALSGTHSRCKSLKFLNMVTTCRVSLNATGINISSFKHLLTAFALLIRATVIAIWFRLPIMGWWRIVSNNHCNNFLLDFKKRNRKPNNIPIRQGMITKVVITIIIMVNQLTNGAALKGVFH